MNVTLPLAPERTVPVRSRPSGSVGCTATRSRACPDPGLALPLAFERTVPVRSRPSGSVGCTATRPRACPDPGLALPLALERAQAPSLHCQMVPCNAISEKEGARAGRIMNMLWLFSFSQPTCHKVLPCISACDFLFVGVMVPRAISPTGCTAFGGRTLAMAPGPRCHGPGGARLTVCHEQAAYRDKL